MLRTCFECTGVLLFHFITHTRTLMVTVNLCTISIYPEICISITGVQHKNWISPLECIISILLISCSGFWNIINNNMGSIHCIIHNIKISNNYISEYLSTLCDISMSYCTGLLKCLCTMIPTLWLPNLRTTKALDPLPFFYGLLILHLTVFGRIF